MSRPGGEAPIVLVADDNPQMRLLLEMTLKRGPYQVVTASDGGEALALARQIRPAVVLLDAEMPILHGFEVCRMLKQDPATREIVVIMITAKAQDEDRSLGLSAGADEYIAKPFSPKLLLARLAERFGASPAG